MTLDYILPWFPVVLSVGVGARLLDAARGIGLGILGAVFWVILVLAAIAPESWGNPWSAASLLAGAAAIVAVGAWAGRDTGLSGVKNRESAENNPTPVPASLAPAALADAVERFDNWLDAHRTEPNPWCDFDEFIRSLLYDTVHATHVRPFRVMEETGELVALTSLDVSDAVHGAEEPTGEPASADLHVPRSTHRNESPGQWPGGSSEAWGFPVTRAGQKIGLVRVGRLDLATVDQRTLNVVRRLICQFWVMLTEVVRCRAAERLDPASKLLTRDPFLAEAGGALDRTYGHGEPAAVVIFAVEGFRTLIDQGHWEQADTLVAEMSRILRERCRSDDCLGRFDDSRFVLLLTRVDSTLAAMIAQQLVGKLNNLLAQRKDWGKGLVARAGVAASAENTRRLVELVADAVARCHDARRTAKPAFVEPPAGASPQAVRSDPATA